MKSKIVAPISGNVISIEVKVGSKVKEDDEVLTIEAMKMETPVFSEFNGIVEEVKIKVGDVVEEDDEMIVLREE